jgi:hypothetical protein
VWGPADDADVIRIPAQCPQTRIARHPVHLQHVPGDVRQPGAADSTWWSPPRGRRPWALCHYPRVEPLPDALQHPSIAPASRDQAHEQGVLDGVAGALAIGLHHPPSLDAGLLDRCYGLVGTTLGANAVRGVRDVGLAEGRDDPRARLLPHPIPHRGNPSGPWPTVRCGEVHSPDGLRAICPGP